MTLHSVNEHFGCNNYATDETSLFFLRDVKPGETIMRNYLDFTLLVFCIVEMLKLIMELTVNYI